ncbi:MAG: hypothetical protein KAJ50_10980 [Bacteroidales bacterium]|nr:hypothetical protein [Bacteroidales bacterium]
MKKNLFFALAIGLFLSAGCGKKDEAATPQAKPAEEIAEKDVQKTQEAIKRITVKAEEVMAELNQSVESVKANVASYTEPEALAHADRYKEIILEKKVQLAALTQKAKSLSMTDLFSEKGKALKTEISKYTSQLAGLKARYEVYLDKLKAFGVDLSTYSL